jgi:hypothetical protein
MIINPVTQRKCKIGSKIYKKLIRDGLIKPEEPVAEVKEADLICDNVKEDDQQLLVKNMSQNAMKVYKKIKSGEVPIPDDMDDDDKLASYIQEMLYLELLKDKPKEKKKKKKKKVVESSSEDESESD